MLGEGKYLVECYTGFHMLGEGKCLVECYTGFRMLGREIFGGVLYRVSYVR